MKTDAGMKGISPLVATVLLMAVTMTIAGFLAYWSSSFVSTQTERFSNQSVATECNFGNFVVYSCVFSSNSSHVNLILSNTGSVELKDLVAYVIYPNNTVPSFSLNGTLPTKSLKPFTLAGVSSGYSKINIRTGCSNVFTEVSC